MLNHLRLFGSLPVLAMAFTQSSAHTQSVEEKLSWGCWSVYTGCNGRSADLQGVPACLNNSSKYDIRAIIKEYFLQVGGLKEHDPAIGANAYAFSRIDPSAQLLDFAQEE